MAKQRRRQDEPGQDALRAETEFEAETLVRGAKIVHALCMRRKHTWPEWDFTGRNRDKLPKGLVIGPIRHDGKLDVTEYCTRGCGEYVTYLTWPSELFAIGIKKNYHRPKDRPVIARDVSRDVWALPLQEAVQDRIMAAAKRATEAADRASARIESRGA